MSDDEKVVEYREQLIDKIESSYGSFVEDGSEAWDVANIVAEGLVMVEEDD